MQIATNTKSTKTVRTEEQFEGRRPGRVYTVRQFTAGSFWCSCPSFKFQRIPSEERACKHTRAFLQRQHLRAA